MCHKRLFTQWLKSGISDLDKYNKQFLTVLTFEPCPLCLAPISLML
jgi:hypothetical protein